MKAKARQENASQTAINGLAKNRRLARFNRISISNVNKIRKVASHDPVANQIALRLDLKTKPGTLSKVPSL